MSASEVSGVAASQAMFNMNNQGSKTTGIRRVASDFM
jgi:hypothetical protein